MELHGIGRPYNASTSFIDKNIANGLAEKTAIYYKDKQITYRKLQEQVNRVGNGLKGLQIGMEDRILILCFDSPEFISTFFGAIRIGAVPIPTNTMMQPADYEYFLNKSRAKVLVVEYGLWEKIEQLKDKFIFLKHVITINESPTQREDVIDFYNLIENASTELEPTITHPDDAAFWLFSSGSTGEPKAVIHLQHDMEFAFHAYAKKVIKINQDDRVFSASKLFFAYGLGNAMYFPLGAGGSTILLEERPTAEKVFETLEKFKPTIFFGVPTLYGTMIDYAERCGRKIDLSSIRICASAGEALPSHFIRKWKNLFDLDILDGIGSTEALHIFLSNSIGDIKEGSSGKIVPGYEAKIVNENGVVVPVNETGDLLIKGDSIAQGYWNLHEQTKRKFNGEWLHTGDKYYQDEEGYFWYCGRSDDMMKVGGIWVSPVEIENSLLNHDFILEVAVVGIKKENGLVTPKAFVVLKEGTLPSESLERELKDYVKQDLAPYKYPRIIEFVDELPKTSTGKIQRFKLRVG
jgi:benzoate-CoA ligase family protein